MPIQYQFITTFGWTNFAAHLVQNSLLDRYTPAPLKAGEIKVLSAGTNKTEGGVCALGVSKAAGICDDLSCSLSS